MRLPRLILAPVLAALLHGSAFADAGYFGSLLSGPSPADPGGVSPNVSMLAEDVFIELLPGDSVGVTAAFLFVCEGRPDSVLMAYPLEVLTVFHPLGLAYPDPEEGGPAPWTDMLDVRVGGRPVEPFVLLQVDLLEDESAEMLELVSRYGYRGTGTGEGPVRLLDREAGGDSLARECDLFHRAGAALACWPVAFQHGDTVLVEIGLECGMTTDYDGNFGRIAYPLVTGASWEGSIGNGRISLVPGEGFDWESLRWFAGICMPSPATFSPWRPLPLPEFAGIDTPALDRFLSREYPHSVVWEFPGFRPVSGNRDTFAFFPDMGLYTDYADAPPEDAEALQLWRSSFVYACTGPEAPTAFYVIAGRGLELLDDCHRGARPAGVAPAGGLATLLESYGGWMKLSCEGGRDSPKVEGWLLPGAPGPDGMVEPEIIPAPGS